MHILYANKVIQLYPLVLQIECILEYVVKLSDCTTKLKLSIFRLHKTYVYLFALFEYDISLFEYSLQWQ